MKDQKNKTKAALPSNWQSQKSTLTRDRITVATLECIVEFGYAGTTMARIANIAGLSAGSMQYHYETKLDAIKSAVNYLHLKRLNENRQDLRNIPPNTHPMDHSVDVYWKHLTEGHFIAYQEIVIAARTDSELAEVLRPAYQNFVKAWREHKRALIETWKEPTQHYELMSNVGQYLLEGLAFAQLNDQLNERQVREVIDYTKKLMRQEETVEEDP